MVAIPPSSSLAGMCLPGGIRLGNAVAAGASGTVYRGWIGTGDDDEMLVAVKVSHADDDHTALRSMREAQAAARLDVEGVVKVASAGRLEDGRSWVAMEWIDGVTLEDALGESDGAGWSVARVLDVAAQLASALAAAHAAGIVHRDLKPANVMMRRDTGNVVIVDFGIAKWAGEAATSASRCAGTPHYMAPEQALGEDCDARADLYALGVVMWRMLSGRVPFDGTAVEVMLAHAGQSVPRIDAQDVPEAVVELVERLMAKRPQERPANAAWVADRLERMVWKATRSSVIAPARARALASTHLSAPPEQSNSEWTGVMPVHATRRGWVAGVLVAAAIAGVSFFAMARARNAMNAVNAVDAASQPALPPLVRPEPTVPGEPVAVVVDGDHSMRATTIGEPVAGGVLDVKLEIWDEHDEPIAASEIAATLRAPGGHTFALGVAGADGVFALRQAIRDAGTYVLTVFAPSGETTFTVRVDVKRRPDV